MSEWGTSRLVFVFEQHVPVDGLGEALMSVDAVDSVRGGTDSLTVTVEVGGNVGPLGNLTSVMHDIEEACTEVGFNPASFTVIASWEPRT